MNHNVGYSGGMNAGIAVAMDKGAETVALLTHDCRINATELTTLAECVAADPTIGAAGPVLYSWESRELFSAGGCLGFRDVGHQHIPVPAGSVRDCDWLDGSVLLLRTVALRQVGGFDERYFLYAEDVDLCVRLRRHGWRCVVVADASAFQEVGSASRRPAYSYLVTRNLIETLLKSRSYLSALGFGVTAARTSWPRLLSSPEMRGVRAVASRRFGPPPPDLLVGTDIAL
jgi:GT2 family glycosyltransferase